MKITFKVIRAEKIREKFFLLLFFFFIFGSLGITYYRESNSVVTAMPVAKKTIVIDAGHGGWDPGKIGTKGDNEKEINLTIANILQQYLEQGGATVIVTRMGDEALGKGKREDMKQRRDIINDSKADILISIHQNSFPRARAKGAQVFYHNDSKKSQALAENIQSQLCTFVDPENQRGAKANTNYYILKNTDMPAAIVECGFLSNPEEELLLNNEAYQEKIAWSIYMGIVDYFEDEEQV